MRNTTINISDPLTKIRIRTSKERIEDLLFETYLVTNLMPLVALFTIGFILTEPYVYVCKKIGFEEAIETDSARHKFIKDSVKAVQKVTEGTGVILNLKDVLEENCDKITKDILNVNHPN